MGVTKESYFQWEHIWFEKKWHVIKRGHGNIHATYTKAPAFTACELMAMIGDYELMRDQHGFMLKKIVAPYANVLSHSAFVRHYPFTVAENEAEALALFLESLLENGHITKESINA